MNRVVKLHPDASRELEEAAQWYEGRRPGLAAQLLDAVDRAVNDLQKWPDAGAGWRGSSDDIRRVGVVGFPYRLVYRMDEQAIWILAVAHERREPGYWENRTTTT